MRESISEFIAEVTFENLFKNLIWELILRGYLGPWQQEFDNFNRNLSESQKISQTHKIFASVAVSSLASLVLGDRRERDLL